MSLQLVHRIYPGEVPRPTPVVEINGSDGVFAVATPWGSRQTVQSVVKTLLDYYGVSRGDREATSPFSKLPSLTPAANNLRIGTLIANDALFKSVNAREFTGACELLVIANTGGETTWIQIGQPHLLLVREGAFIPLSIAVDLSVDFQSQVPLPGKLLGIDRQVEIETKSVSHRAGDMLVALSRTLIPNALFGTRVNGLSAEQICHLVFNAAVQADAHQPFWLGVIQMG